MVCSESCLCGTANMALSVSNTLGPFHAKKTNFVVSLILGNFRAANCPNENHQ